MVSSISTNQMVNIYGGRNNGLPILNPQKPGSAEFITAMSELKEATHAYRRARIERSRINGGNIMKQTRPNLEKALQRAKAAIEALKKKDDMEFNAAITRGENLFKASYRTLHG